jgi:DNA-binding MarR family transcriptional regulator
MQTRTTAPAAVLITRLSRVIYRYVDEGELGMTMKQYGMLNYLRDFDGITQGKLGEAVGLDANTVVLLLNALEDRGFAVRERDPNDRRRHLVRITAAGTKALVRGDRRLAIGRTEAQAELSPARGEGDFLLELDLEPLRCVGRNRGDLGREGRPPAS